MNDYRKIVVSIIIQIILQSFFCVLHWQIRFQEKTLENLKKVILENNLNTDAMMIQMKSILQTFRNNSLAIGYDGRNCKGYGEPNGPVHEWSWAGALMFSVTVITTIGKNNEMSLSIFTSK